MTLPQAFVDNIGMILAADEREAFLHALTQTDASVSIRYNPNKDNDNGSTLLRSLAKEAYAPVGWCPEGYYLQGERPLFTTDPRLHAGTYYVQEAASMFVAHVLRSLIQTPVTCLDLCAAPGGKTTAALSALPEGSLMVSNEIDRKRARILAENVIKWGNPHTVVTCNAPADFANLRHTFDVIIADVPCSGEGMFRKDAGAIADWSPAKVSQCADLQRQILDDIWPTLRPGGLLIYSTCTFNTDENESQLDYICQELGATALTVPTQNEWNIHAPLQGNRPCYRFMPHYTQGEGLFMAVVRKDDNNESCSSYHSRQDKKNRNNKTKKGATPPKADISSLKKWFNQDVVLQTLPDNTVRTIPPTLATLLEIIENQSLYILSAGTQTAHIKGRDLIPAHPLALSTILSSEAFPRIHVNIETALSYLRRDNITLPADAPIGYALICYENYPLGFVKNIGSRANNLYPQEWRIRYC